MNGIAVVGGGLSGLTLGHALAGAGLTSDLLVLEGRALPGGHLRTERAGGFLCERGPASLLDSSEPVLRLIDALGLADRVTPAGAAARRRYLYAHGALHPLPVSPPALLRSRLLTWTGRMRLLLEPLVPRGGSDDETVHAFVARRFGRQAADALAGPLVTGIFAGDAGQLSMRACFPSVCALEAEHGSLLRALAARRRPAGDGGGPRWPGRQFSFHDGLGELTAALAHALGPALRTGTPVARIARRDGGFTLHLAGGGRVDAAALVLACGAQATARLVRELDAELAREIDAIAEPPVAVVALGYPAHAIGRPLDGFGFLVPRGQGLRILGTLWESAIYPGRAPEGHALLRAMVGGATDPDVLRLADDDLVALVRRELATVMGIEGEPVLARVFRHAPGIPQYTAGHLARLDRIAARTAAHPGLFLAGIPYRGVSMPHCVEEAAALAPRVAAFAARGALAQ